MDGSQVDRVDMIMIQDMRKHLCEYDELPTGSSLKWSVLNSVSWVFPVIAADTFGIYLVGIGLCNYPIKIIWTPNWTLRVVHQKLKTFFPFLQYFTVYPTCSHSLYEKRVYMGGKILEFP